MSDTKKELKTFYRKKWSNEVLYIDRVYRVYRVISMSLYLAELFFCYEIKSKILIKVEIV